MLRSILIHACASLFIMAKRRHDIVDVSDVNTSSPNATVGGILTCVSPMKKSKKSAFFEGSITDGRSSMRFYGFDSVVRRKLVDHMQSKEPIVLENCEIKTSRLRDELELYVSPRTELEKSSKMYDMDELDTLETTTLTKEVSLVDIQNIASYERVTVTVKVSDVDSPSEVKGGKKKQDIIITDATAVARFTVWEDDINRLQQGKSYKLTDVLVREYNSKKYLSTALENTTIQEVTDIGQVIDPNEEDVDKNLGVTQTIENVRVVGVVFLKEYYKCLKCSSKVISSDDPEIGKCSKCLMQQLLDACISTVSAQLMIKAGTNQSLTLMVHGDTLKDIANSDQVTITSLLKAPPFTVLFKEEVIRSISRD